MVLDTNQSYASAVYVKSRTVNQAAFAPRLHFFYMGKITFCQRRPRGVARVAEKHHQRPAMIDKKQACLNALTQMGIAYENHDHAPVFTVDEGRDIKARLPGGHTKNLFLKSKDGQFVLVCALGDTAISVNQLHKRLGTKRLSFGKPEDMERLLGVTPGSVSLFGIMNDKGGEVRLVIDGALASCDIVNFHPLLNDATTAISSKDMMRFAEATGHHPTVIDFSKQGTD